MLFTACGRADKTSYIFWKEHQLRGICFSPYLCIVRMTDELMLQRKQNYKFKKENYED